jgi:hypothetical protein
VPVPTPDGATRWRCARCGNLTRFDVVRSVRTREYVHADLEGESRVEEREVLGETVERVTCRWCQGEDTVELVARPGAAATADGSGTEVPGSTVRREATSPSEAGGGAERAPASDPPSTARREATSPSEARGGVERKGTP